MDYFLRKGDYYTLIQQENLDVVISADENIRTAMELASEQEMKSYIRNRYDEDLIFAPLQPYLTSTTFYWGDRIYLTATAFNPATVYTTGQMVLQAGYVYYSTAGSSAHAFNVLEWTLLGAEGHYQMQVNLWDDKTSYSINDTVRYETLAVRKWYKCLIANYGVDPYTDTESKWIEVLSSSGKIPTNTLYWTAGDSRNNHIMMLYIDLTLYHLHSRISPRNIPEWRVQRRDDAIKYLDKIAKGLVTAELEIIAPEQGNNIAFGSQPVQNNYY